SCYVSSSLLYPSLVSFFFFFFNYTATTEIYTLSLHDALPISAAGGGGLRRLPREHRRSLREHRRPLQGRQRRRSRDSGGGERPRSEEHTSELQSLTNLVCRLLLEKKKKHETITLRE